MTQPDTLRLEMKYALYGNDIDETTNPLEAGLAWVVKPAKGPLVPAALAAVGSAIAVEVRGRGQAARVVKTPFHPPRVKR